MKIREVRAAELPALVRMAQQLFHETDEESLEEEFLTILASEKDQVFLALVKEIPIGFLHMSLRHDYVEGATDYPVGYMEGIYVEPDYRKQKVASELVRAGEQWAREKGCTEIASDAECENVLSHTFHKMVGYHMISKTVHFIKELETESE